MQKLGILVENGKMKEFDGWITFIPPFFIIVAFVLLYIQYRVESWIEARELDRKLAREARSKAMKKYYVKKEDKFDKVNYLADMYWLIRQNLALIKQKIEENERLTQNEGADNINKMLKDKYDLMQTIGESPDLMAVQAKIKEMLENLRFTDGRSLIEVLDSQRVQKQLEAEEARLKQINEEAEANKDDMSDSFESQALTTSQLDDDEKDEFMDDIEDENDDENLEFGDNVRGENDFAEDTIQQRADLKRKRNEFI
jgi:hypothetical protein